MTSRRTLATRHDDDNFFFSEINAQLTANKFVDRVLAFIINHILVPSTHTQSHTHTHTHTHTQTHIHTRVIVI